MRNVQDSKFIRGFQDSVRWGVYMTIVYKSVYKNKSGQKKRRLNLAIDVDLADKLITEASKKYGARGISKFIEELIIDYFERQKAELSKLVENAVK